MRGHARGASMTFTQIGQEMGVTKQCAQRLYRNAMRKLHCRPGVVNALHELGREVDRQRQRRQSESDAQIQEIIQEAQRGNL